MAETYTDQQLKDWARRYVLAAAANLDYGLVGEMFEEEWDPITPDFDAFQALARKVYDLACAALAVWLIAAQLAAASMAAPRRATPRRRRYVGSHSRKGVTARG